jgi:hypothetical protein
MVTELLEPVPDDELTAVLSAALGASGGQITRPTACWMASVAADHPVSRMALAGLKVVRRREGKTF